MILDEVKVHSATPISDVLLQPAKTSLHPNRRWLSHHIVQPTAATPTLLHVVIRRKPLVAIEIIMPRDNTALYVCTATAIVENGEHGRYEYTALQTA